MTEYLPGAEYVVVGDLGGTTEWRDALTDIDVVIHTAGLAHGRTDGGANDVHAYRRVNLQGTVRLAAGAAKARVRRLVFVSSVGVNGSWTAPDEVFAESSVPRPGNPYAVSKWEAEQGLLGIGATHGLEIVIVRPPLVYGPNAPGNFGTLARAVGRGWPLPMGAIRNQRSFIGLDNLVDFLLICATDPRAANQTFLISDGQDVSTTQFVRGMALAAGVRLALLPVPQWALTAVAVAAGQGPMVRSLYCDLRIDIAKARGLLEWTAPLKMLEGLRRAMLAPRAHTRGKQS
jgi:nucleoside-diphosphate-sugar epimerase